MAKLGGVVRRRRIIGVAYGDDESPRPCDIECWLAPDGAWSVDFDWSDSGESIRAHGDGATAQALLGRVTASPPPVPRPGD